MTAQNPDGPAASCPDGDACGQAALLLVESLIHELVGRSVLSVQNALAVIDIAIDTQMALMEDTRSPTPSMRQAHALLARMHDSLTADLRD